MGRIGAGMSAGISARWRLVAVLGLAACALGAGVKPSRAEGPWCAILTGRFGGAENFGFYSFAQCVDYVRGVGGFCRENASYARPQPRPAPRKRRHRRD